MHARVQSDLKAPCNDAPAKVSSIAPASQQPKAILSPIFCVLFCLLFPTIALASTFARSGTFAFAQAGGPNGTVGDPASLTGPSASGGDSPGAVGRNAPAGPGAGGSMSGGTTGSAAGNQPCDNPNRCPGGPVRRADRKDCGPLIFRTLAFGQ